MPDSLTSRKILFLIFALLIITTASAGAKSIRPLPETAAPVAVDSRPELSRRTAEHEEWQFFRINAQYRGTVKKSFANLGCAIAWFNDLSPDQTQVIIHVSALHPEKRKQKYAFRMNLIFKRNGAIYTLLKQNYADFSGITGDRQTRLQQLAALWVYMRDYAREPKLYKELEVCGTQLKLSELIRGKGRNREVDCSWPARRGFHGKFFFERAVDPVFKEILALDKLRFRSGKLSVSLIKDSQAAILRDFAGKEPFATSVFK
jgi:hypothetical protein